MNDGKCRCQQEQSLPQKAGCGALTFLATLAALRTMLPLLEVQLPITDHVWLAAVLAALALVQSYALRCLFDHLAHLRDLDEQHRRWRLQRSLRTGML